jgi:hypothetical protein
MFGSFLRLVVSDAKPKISSPVMVKAWRKYFPFTSANTRNRPPDTQLSDLVIKKDSWQFWRSFLRHDAGTSLEICSRSPIEDQHFLFLDNCATVYWRFALVRIEYELIQSTYTNCSTVSVHEVLICWRHWLIQELSFAVDLLTSTALTRSWYSLVRGRYYTNDCIPTSKVGLSA